MRSCNPFVALTINTRANSFKNRFYTQMSNRSVQDTASSVQDVPFTTTTLSLPPQTTSTSSTIKSSDATGQCQHWRTFVPPSIVSVPKASTARTRVNQGLPDAVSTSSGLLSVSCLWCSTACVSYGNVKVRYEIGGQLFRSDLNRQETS